MNMKEAVDRTCENCWYYKVCENGCWGSIEPCEHFTNYDMEVNQNDK